MTSVILILAGFYVGWNIGANDAANCIGTAVDTQIISYRKAVAIMAIFIILSGVLKGHNVMKTEGKGIVISDAAYFKFGVLAKIFGARMISPILTAALAFILYIILGRLLKRTNSIVWSQILRIAVVVSAAYLSFSLGANDMGYAIGHRKSHGRECD